MLNKVAAGSGCSAKSTIETEKKKKQLPIPNLENKFGAMEKYGMIFKKHGDKLELMFLPPYSLNLNLIERFWRFMRKTVTHYAFFKCFKEFLRALIKFFRKFKFPTQKIRSSYRII